MGKKLPILTNEEQDEKKLEYYQTMSAFIGKSISELLGNEQYNDNYPNNDCKSKEIILKGLYEPATSRQLYDTVKSQGYQGKYKTFTSLLARYQNPKYGYIQKLTNEKPIMYGLTEYGKLNAKNPKMLREEGIRRYREYRKKEIRDIILNDPERFKEIYESIFGENSFNNFTNFIASGGNSYNSQSNDNDFGGSRDAKIEEMRENIEDDGFLQGISEDKIKELIKIGDADLLIDFYLNLNDYHKRHKTTMCIGNNPNNVPAGKTNDKKSMPNYFPEMFSNFGKEVTEELFNLIPYRFYKHKASGKIRIGGRNEAGNYQNNDDGEVIEFNKVLRNIFSGNMKIDGVRTVENGEEIIKVYYRNNNSQIKYHILNCSMDQYNECLNIPKEKPKTLSMNGKPIGGSPIQPKI
ncbi:MAG: hypothetical protein RBQ97_09645, partial [Acholeplasma sp.]|nr:hypothetical protein [Acholeplasma sp.]